MKKLISILFVLLFHLSGFCQLDTEHWFAPMFSRSSTATSYGNYQALYLSTNETTPFEVEIYNNNTKISTISISKGNPQKVLIDRKYIISSENNDLFTPTNMGLYVKGSKKFYANLRFSIPNHAEIITSKGLAGIGTKFYAIIPPLLSTPTQNNSNFMTGILATENNTKVKISGYKHNVKFSKLSSTPNSIEFTLNKGQSYIIEGSLLDKYNKVIAGNRAGFIGAKIEADKPINITSGNFNGQYTPHNDTSSDIIMDQSVPIDRLGNEFAIIKGNGKIGDGLEDALIVATENNTQIYINDETSPIITLQEGECYIIPDYKYQKKGNNEHYNLYVKSSKNIYLYQLLAGTGVYGSAATLGIQICEGKSTRVESISQIAGTNLLG